MQSLINIKSILLGFFLLCITTILYFNRWQPENIIQHDTKYYYAYLPHFFIQDSLAYNVDSIYFLNNPTESIKMSSGLALVWVPFFSVAHLSTYLFINVMPNGYTFPYSISIVASNILVTLFGLYIVYLLLRRLSFNERISKAVIVSIFLGTTLYYYATFELMPHTYLFAGISMLIYLIFIWYNQLTFFKSMLIGLLVGWIVLTRPIDIMVLIPIFLYIRISMSINDIRIFIDENLKYIFIAFFSSIFILSIQLFYWKFQTGNWIYWSYGSESFYFLKPHLIEGLIGFRKGWFVYTPLMILGCVGLYMSPKRIALSITLFLMLFTYVVFSWWNWWYGGSLGCRPMLDVYVFLAVGLAYFYQYIQNHQKKHVKILLSTITILFVVYGLKLNVQGFYEWIHWDGMTYTSWKKSIFMHKLDKDYLESIKRPNEQNQLKTGEEN